MISAPALVLIQRAIDTRSLEYEQRLIDYLGALEEAAPDVPRPVLPEQGRPIPPPNREVKAFFGY